MANAHKTRTMRIKPAEVSHRNQKGYFLLEILITVVVLSLGLLGVAAMQYTGLRDNNRSNERSLATIVAYDIVDRMRANRTGAQDGDYRIPDPTTAPTIPDGGSYNCIDDFTDTTTSNICSSTEMANADLVQWWNNVLDVLPSGAAQIICTDGAGTVTVTCPAGSVHTVTIMWDDARTGATGTGCDPTDTNDMLCMVIDVEL